MGYGTDFGSIGGTASPGSSQKGAISRYLDNKISNAGSGDGAPDSTYVSGESTSSDVSATARKKYNPKKYMKHMKACHKKHTHTKSCGRK